jgi:hypothetical protein
MDRTPHTSRSKRRQQQAVKCWWRLKVTVKADTWFSMDRSSDSSARSAAVSPVLNIAIRSNRLTLSAARLPASLQPSLHPWTTFKEAKCNREQEARKEQRARGRGRERGEAISSIHPYIHSFMWASRNHEYHWLGNQQLAVFFLAIVCYSQIGDHPQEDLARFSY